MAKVGRQYKKCENCEGAGFVPMYEGIIIGNHWTKCKICTQGKYSDLPKGMVTVDT